MRPDAAGEDVFGDEPWIDAEKPLEARDQQACADQEHERERDLRDDERPAHVL
jgi:hypothetical protein